MTGLHVRELCQVLSPALAEKLQEVRLLSSCGDGMFELSENYHLWPNPGSGPTRNIFNGLLSGLGFRL